MRRNLIALAAVAALAAAACGDATSATDSVAQADTRTGMADATPAGTPTPTPEPPVDTDGDGTPDEDDAFPKNPRFSKDTDGDGVADRKDYDPNDPDVQKAPQPVSYAGSRTTVLEIDKPEGFDSIGVATITHQGGSNFSVWSLDQNLEQNDLLVNEIGAYTGTVLFDIREGENSSAFEIGADGSWTIELLPLSSIRSFDTTADGSGDDVLIYRGDSGIADIQNEGDNNFAIWKYGEDSDLLVNEIGPYSGQVPVRGAGVFAITATGPWSISIN